jgi:hypothetical protein
MTPESVAELGGRGIPELLHTDRKRIRNRTMAERVRLTMADGVVDVRLNRADKMNALDLAGPSVIDAGLTVNAN